jgi:hypothetical protein
MIRQVMALHQVSAWNRRICFSTLSLESAEHARKHPNGVLNVRLRRNGEMCFSKQAKDNNAPAGARGPSKVACSALDVYDTIAPSLCHDCSLTRLHLQLGIKLHVQPLCLQSYLTTVSKTFEYRYGSNNIKR